MTESKRPLKVFLCHAHSDKDTVKALYTRLTQDGVDAWLDDENLLPGQVWRTVIEESVRASDIVLVCLSNQSITKEGFVQKEIKIALDVADEKPEGTIYVIPARLDECVVPSRLGDLQWVDLYKDNGYSRLLKALAVRGEQIEKSRVEKEDAIRHRLPTKDAPFTTQHNVLQQRRQSTTLQDASAKPDQYSSVEDSSNKKSKIKRPRKTEYVVAIIGAIATLVAGILGSPLIEKWFSPAPVAIETTTTTFTVTSQPITPSQILETVQPSKNPTNVVTPTISFIFTETATPKPIPTHTTMSTPTGTSTFTPTPITISDIYATMVLIPKGIFQWKDGQKNVPAFYIDQHEVTNSQYEQCVEEGACLPLFPPDNEDYQYVQHYSNNIIERGYEEYPVVLASWNMAKNYCEWRGRKTRTSTRLPYDYEWEKAARGSLINQPYPWGSSAPSCDLGNLNGANFSECSPNIGGKNKGDAFPVKSFAPNGYGVYDMSGNVAEWIDYFRSTSSGDERMIMGGSWFDNANGIQVDSAILQILDMSGESFLNVGFRCARDATP